MAIGSVWAAGTWAEDAWAAGAWANVAEAVAVVDGTYAAEHASALADVRAAGAAASFARHTRTRGTGGAFTNTETAIAGYAMRVRARQSEVHQFAASGTSTSETAVLFFVPTTFGERPQPADTLTWESLGWTTVWVNPIAPNGVTIAARVGVRR